MKKPLIYALLTAVIAATISYSILYYSFNLTNPDNTINKLYRKRIITQNYLRNIFRLNQVGDARFDYANSGEFTKLKVRIYYHEEEALGPETIKSISEELKQVIQKPEGITFEETVLTVATSGVVEDKDLQQLAQRYSIDWSIFRNTATVQIFVLKKYSPHPTYTGLVEDAQNIFLFMDALRDVSNRQRSTQDAEISTILHEFAHLLGAEHVEDTSCILSEGVENLTYGLPTIMSTSYCQIDLDEIKRSLSF